MTGTFHWIKVKLFCYSTENDEVLEEVMTKLIGSDEFSVEISEGHHGNLMLIFDAELTKDKEIIPLFKNLGETIVRYVIDTINDRVDDDCVFYIRLDKQKAVLGGYEIAHHGDVISITGKIVSHPAKKSIAEERLKEFLLRI